MELIKIEDISIQQLFSPIPVIATLGQFDGLHKAHLDLMEYTIKLANEKKYKSAVITFNPHPDFVLKKRVANDYITPLDIKAKIVESLGIDYFIVVKFDAKLATTDHQTFVEMLLINNNIKEVVVGFDYSYGYKGLGNASTIEDDSHGLIKVNVIDEIQYNEKKVCSTYIRELLTEGKVEEVTQLLKRPWVIVGSVVRGRQIGTQLNVPTANIAISENYAKIKSGVYGVIVEHKGQKYKGICNVGHNPSFNFRTDISVEVNILDFNEQIYGDQLTIFFICHIRDEIIFASVEEFKEQLAIDRLVAEKSISL